MRYWDALGLEDFLAAHPRIRITEINDSRLVLTGEYHLKAQLAGSQLIDRTYRLKLICPNDYPETPPQVFDDERYFPREAEYHTYADGSFCLGSALKMRLLLQDDHTLSMFFEKIVDQFLYAVTHRIEFGNFPYGDLEHGEQGLIDDYSQLFGLNGKSSILLALRALGKRKREANKLPCPCGCFSRLGLCRFRYSLNEFRKIARRRWFRQHLKESFTPVKKIDRKSKNYRATSKTVMSGFRKY